jgi:hypothetical protein
MVIALITTLAIGAIAVIGWIYTRRRRSEQLRTHFGREYDRAVAEFGDRTRAEKELARREDRLRNLHIRGLTAEQQQRYSQQWGLVQHRFVEEPGVAVLEADRLVTDVMAARGFAAGDFNQRLDDISAAYPGMRAKYREACAVAALSRGGDGATEDLRRAVILYRDLFDELLGEEHHEKLRRVS